MLRCFRQIVLVLVVWVLVISPVVAQDRSLELGSMGMFFVGGSRLDDATLGQAEWAGQSLVQYLQPKVSSRTYPVVLYPGLGLSSHIFMATPDDRDGWAQILVRAGFDVYVYDPAETDPSTLPSVDFRRVEDGIDPVSSLPGVRKWNIPQIWPRWGLGPSEGVPNPNVRFPLSHVEQFYSGWPARVGGGGGGGNNDDFNNMVELLEKIGEKVILVPHSAAGPVAFDIARDRPELVRALVVIEPTGCPDDPADLWPDPVDTPFFAVYGDYITQRNQTGRLAACTATAQNVTNAGGVGEVLELTQQGILGNTHLMMVDDNNADIASNIVSWIEQNVDPPTPSGFVPDGEFVSGDPLQVSLESSGDLTLAWGAPICGDPQADYEIYEGPIGDFTAAVPLVCSTDGATQVTVSSSTPNAFFLAVPRSQTREGGYGFRSDGTQRAPSSSACLQQQVDNCQ